MLATLMNRLPDGSSSTTLLRFSPDPAASDMVVIDEITLTDVTGTVRNVRGLLEASPQWAEVQQSLDCHKQLNDVQVGAWVEGQGIRVHFSAAAEVDWCASANVPCPTTLEPFRFCVKESKGKLWGARTESSGLAVLRYDPSAGLSIQMTDVSSSTSTSPEQDFVRDIFGSMFGGPVGIDFIRNMESGALRSIEQATGQGIEQASLTLPDGTFPGPFPNYHPVYVRSLFRNSGIPNVDGQHVEAVVERQASGIREGTGCSFAHKLNATYANRGR